MDKRHTSIVEGAGLEESRINTDFADWLKRWGSPILLGVLVLALGYRGWMWYQNKQVQELDSAFVELDAAAQAGHPAALVQVANDWAGRATVSFQAKLEAADRFMLAYATGVKPGGQAGNPEDRASDKDLEDYLAQADRLYRDVHDATRSKSDYAILAVRALSGMSAIAGTRGDFAGAQSHVEEIIEIAEANGLDGLAQAMQDRLELLASAPQPAPLLPQHEISAYRPQTSPDEDGEFMTPEELLQNLDTSSFGPAVEPIGESETEETSAPEAPTQEPPAPEGESQGG